jgi:hypothetical protein
MITEDQESKKRIQSPLDLDYFCARYRTTNGLYSFSSPSLWTIDKYLYYLLSNSQEKTFQSQYRMRPDYLSFDEYGTVILAPVLMYVNGVFCLEDFDLDTVYIPSFSSIADIVQDKFTSKGLSDLEGITW